MVFSFEISEVEENLDDKPKVGAIEDISIVEDEEEQNFSDSSEIPESLSELPKGDLENLVQKIDPPQEIIQSKQHAVPDIKKPNEITSIDNEANSQLQYDEEIAEKRKEERKERYKNFLKDQHNKNIQKAAEQQKKSKQQSSKIKNDKKLEYALEQTKIKPLEIVRNIIIQEGTKYKSTIHFNQNIGDVTWKYPYEYPDSMAKFEINPKPIEEIEWYLKTPNEIQFITKLQGSTKYEIKIPNNFTSYDKSLKIEKEQIIIQQTKKIQLIKTWPNENELIPPKPIIILSFNQEPKISTLISHLHCKTNNKEYKLTQITEEEYQNHINSTKYRTNVHEIPKLSNLNIGFKIETNNTSLSFGSSLIIILKQGWEPLEGNILSDQNYDPLIKYNIGQSLKPTLQLESEIKLQIQFNHLLFNQLKQLDNEFIDQFIEINPKPLHKGTWRSVSHSTLIYTPTFEGEIFQASTKYNILIKKGFFYHDNNQFYLQENQEFNCVISMNLNAFYPNTNHLFPVSCPLQFVFSQKIDKSSILNYIKLYECRKLKSDKEIQLSIITDEKTILPCYLTNFLQEYKKEDNYVYLQPNQKLKHSTKYIWKLLPGCKSLLGPEPSFISNEIKFKTTDELQIQVIKDNSDEISFQFSQSITKIFVCLVELESNILDYGGNEMYTLQYNANYSLPNSLLTIKKTLIPFNTEYSLLFSKDDKISYTSFNEPILLNSPLKFFGKFNEVIDVYTPQSNNNYISPFPQFCISFARIISDIPEVFTINNKPLVTIHDPNDYFPLIIDYINNLPNESNYFICQAENALPYDCEVELRIPKLSSVEGPLYSPEYTKKFHTNPIFDIKEYSSTIDNTIQIVFSNPLINQFKNNIPYQIVKDINKIKEEYQPKINPDIEGYWEIIKTDTICFYPKNQLPNATEFIITIPEGFASSNGTCLTKEKQFIMKTKLPQIISHFPSHKNSSSFPMYLIAFNMKINEDDFLSKCKLKIQGINEFIPMIKATEEQIKKNYEISSHIHIQKNFYQDYIVIISNISCPYNKSGELVIEEGLKSIEGKLTSIQSYTIQFKIKNRFDYLSNQLISDRKYNLADENLIKFHYQFTFKFSQYLNENQNIFPLIVPKLNGSWEIYRDTLLFHVNDDENFPLSTEFSIKIPKEIESENGDNLPNSHSFTMESARPTCKIIQPSQVNIEQNEYFILRFNQFINIESLLRKCSFKVKGTSILSNSVISSRLLTEDEKKEENLLDEINEFDYIIKPSKLLPINSIITFRIKEGIKPIQGKLFSNQIIELKYNTSIKSDHQISINKQIPFKQFKIEKINAPNPFFYSNKIEIFTNDVVHDIGSIIYSHMDDIEIHSSIRGTIITLIILPKNENLFKKDILLKIKLSNACNRCGSKLSNSDKEISIKVHSNTFSCGLHSIEENEILIRKASLDHINNNENSHYLYSFYSYNYHELRVCMFQMNPKKDLLKWQKKKIKTQFETLSNPIGCGKKISDEIITIDNFKENTEILVSLSLYEKLNLISLENTNACCQIGIFICPTSRSHFPNPNRYMDYIRVWIQYTNIGLDVFGDFNGLCCWTTDLDHKTGAKENLSLTIIDQDNKKVIETYNSQSLKSNFYGISKIGNLETFHYYSVIVYDEINVDCVFLSNILVKDSEKIVNKNEILWYCFTDRGCYNPNENLIIQGYIRIKTIENNNNYENLEIPTNYSVFACIYDETNLLITKINKIIISGYGNFYIDYKIPKNINLGKCKVVFTLQSLLDEKEHLHIVNNEHIIYFQLQEFKIPQFKVKTEILTKEIKYFDSIIILQGLASYYSGTNLVDNEIEWKLSAIYATFTDFNKENFEFSNYYFYETSKKESNTILYSNSLKTLTNLNGMSFIKILCFGSQEKSPIQINASLEVIDDVDHENPSQISFIIYPYQLSIGLYSNDYPIIKNSTFSYQIIVINNSTLESIENIPIQIKIIKKYSNASQNTVNQIFTSNKKPIIENISIDYSVKEVLICAFIVDDKNNILTSCDLHFTVSNRLKNSIQSNNNNNQISSYSKLIYDEKYLDSSLAKHTPLLSDGTFPCLSNACIQYIASDCQSVSVGLYISYCNGILNFNCFSSAERINHDKIISNNILFTEEKFIPNLYYKSLLLGISNDNKLTKWLGSFSLTISNDIKSLKLNIISDHDIYCPSSMISISVHVFSPLDDKKSIENADVTLFVVDDATLDIIGYHPFKKSILNCFYPLRDNIKHSLYLGHYSNRDFISYYEQLPPPLSDNEISNYYGHPGDRIIKNLPKIKDKRMKTVRQNKSIEGPVLFDILDTAGQEE